MLLDLDMSTFKTQALILHKRVLKNADRLYILYTPDHGKVEAKVRSAAKSSSKLAGHLEPFCISAVMIARGKELETIAGAYLQKSFSFKDLKTRALAGLAAEIVNKFIRPGLASGEIYRLLVLYFEALEKSEKFLLSQILGLRFIWQILIKLGYRINLENKDRQTLALSQEARGVLQNCLVDQNDLTNHACSSTVIKELAEFTRQYLVYHLEDDLKSFTLSFYA